MERLSIVAFTHRNLSLEDIGKLHIDPEARKEKLNLSKADNGIDELMYLSTCNRVEFMFNVNEPVNEKSLANFLKSLFPNLSETEIDRYIDTAAIFNGYSAVEHLLSVASSVDSMVVGEREIITQVRSAFEESRNLGLSGDLIRIVIRHTIETAKRVYTETSIAKRPVSVVSLAYHKLRDLNVPLDSRILIVGAGVTNTNMSRFLKKHGFTNFHVFNRTLSKAENLARDLNGTALPLKDLSTFNLGFDIIITCTGSEGHLITPEIYHSLLRGEKDKKIVIDLAIPQDLAPEIKNNYSVNHISIEVLQVISNENLKARSEEIRHVEEILREAIYEFEEIFRMREIELAMRDVPQKVKEIRKNAMTEIFNKELDEIDDNSRLIVEKIVDYMEKKYMSIPMLMAKDILMKQKRNV